MKSFAFSADKSYIFEWGSGIRYNGHKVYKYDSSRGQNIGVSFGDDSYNASIARENYLKQAALAWSYMHDHGVDEITVDIDDEDNAVIMPIYRVDVCSGNRTDITGTITYALYNDKNEGQRAFDSYCEDAEKYFLDTHREPPAAFKDRVITILFSNEMTDDVYAVYKYSIETWESENK